jgi:hypothetical protein
MSNYNTLLMNLNKSHVGFDGSAFEMYYRDIYESFANVTPDVRASHWKDLIKIIYRSPTPSPIIDVCMYAIAVNDSSAIKIKIILNYHMLLRWARGNCNYELANDIFPIVLEKVLLLSVEDQ